MIAYYGHKGDPILSSDGNRIVATWRQEKVFEYRIVRFAVVEVPDLRLRDMPVDGDDVLSCIATIECVLSSKALSVWRFAVSNVDDDLAVRSSDILEPYDRVRLAARTLAALPNLPEYDARLIHYIAKAGWREA